MSLNEEHFIIITKQVLKVKNFFYLLKLLSHRCDPSITTYLILIDINLKCKAFFQFFYFAFFISPIAYFYSLLLAKISLYPAILSDIRLIYAYLDTKSLLFSFSSDIANF